MIMSEIKRIFIIMCTGSYSACVRVRACVRACVCACVRACMYVCCVWSVSHLTFILQLTNNCPRDAFVSKL